VIREIWQKYGGLQHMYLRVLDGKVKMIGKEWTIQDINIESLFFIEVWIEF
jgi:hypothetical protein